MQKVYGLALKTRLIPVVCFFCVCVCLDRDSLSAVGAAEMSGAADGDESTAPPGPAGFLPQEVRDRERVLAQPGEAG